MRLKIILFCLISTVVTYERAESGIGLAFAEGVALASLVDWMMNELNPTRKPSVEERFDRGTLTVYLRAALDPFFEQELINQAFPLFDPRRYILLGMFQAGRLAPKAMDFLTQLASNISGRWVQKKTEIKTIPAFKGQDLPSWSTDVTCPATNQTLWEKILNNVSLVKEMAISCLVGYLIYYVTNKLIGSSRLNINADATRLIAQQVGVAGGTYLIEWARNVLNDISKIEKIPLFQETPVAQFAPPAVSPES